MTVHLIGPNASVFRDADRQIEYFSILVKPIVGVTKTFGEVASAYERVLEQLEMLVGVVIHQHDPYLCLTGEDNLPCSEAILSGDSKRGIVGSSAIRSADLQWTVVAAIVACPDLGEESICNLSDHAGPDFRLIAFPSSRLREDFVSSVIAGGGSVSVEADGESELLVGTMTDNSAPEPDGAAI